MREAGAGKKHGKTKTEEGGSSRGEEEKEEGEEGNKEENERNDEGVGVKAEGHTTVKAEC